jgi:pyruvate formate lyase activating enzyme
MSVQLFRSRDSRDFECLLCPHHCILKPGMQGICRVRKADSNAIFSSLDPVTVIAEDPIEKKPFYHFLPGSKTLSIGFSGCNMSCPFCQNHDLVESRMTHETWTPEFIVQTAVERKSRSVCFTYSEPTMHIEYLIKCSSLLKKAGIPALLVTNGCINKEPARWLLEHLSAVKVDLKSFNAEWYKNELKGDLDTVCSFIETAYGLCHLEIVSLIIPDINDSVDEITASADFLSGLSENIPFHLTAYYPQHKYSIPPTSASVLNRLQKIAKEKLTYVYTGNTGLVENTSCPDCGNLLVNRYKGRAVGISTNHCSNCGTEIYGSF